MAKQYPRIIALVSLLALLVALVPAGGVSAQATPTLNGLFYGDGDYQKYVFLSQNPGRGNLYYYLDEDFTTNPPTRELYIAVVVLPSVNDNVIGPTKSPYVDTAMWNPDHRATELIQSDHVEMNLTCDGTSYIWQQDYTYADPNGDQWISDQYGPDGNLACEGGPCPGNPWVLQASSSLAWNLNSSSWDYTLGQSPAPVSVWQSPDTDGGDPPALPGDDTIIGEIGWSESLSDTNNIWWWHADNPGEGWVDNLGWEWTMVYEMKIDLYGACGLAFPSPIVQSAHNSPAKSGAEDVPFAFYDLGDAPEGEMINAGTSKAVMANYGTALANNGPKHQVIADPVTGQITSPIFGLVVDSEGDGQPGLPAADDDFRPYLIPGFGNDDEDGLQMPLPQLAAGQSYTLWFTGTAGAHLDGWIDLNLNGVFDEGAIGASDRVADETLTGAAQSISFTVPTSPTFPTDEQVVTYARFRVHSGSSSRPPTEPFEVLDPNLGGIVAEDGEVEDYVLSSVIPTAVDLANFGAQAQDGAIEVAWETADEIDNLGFNLYRAASKAGARVKLNDGLIPSQVAPGSPVGAAYTWLDEDVEAGTTYYYWLEDVESSGKTKLHGPVTAEVVNLTFEPVQPVPIRRIMPVRLR